MHHQHLEEQLEFDFMESRYNFDIPEFITDYFEDFLEEKTESDSNSNNDKNLTTSSHGTF